jgi:hypothetical protein
MFYSGEQWAKRVGNLGHGGYLPVEVPAVDIYGKGIVWHIDLKRIDLHVNVLAVKFELGTVKPEAFCSPHELQELWNGKRELLVVVNLKNLEARSGDPIKNSF